MPPSGANTSSPCAMDFCIACKLPGSRKNVTRNNRLNAAVGKAEQQTAIFVERFEAPRQRTARQPRLHLFADAAGAFEPVGANGRKTLAAAPAIKPPHHGKRQGR